MPEIWWRIYETRHPAEADIDAWFATEPDIAIVAGSSWTQMCARDLPQQMGYRTAAGYLMRVRSVSALAPRRPPTLVLSAILLIVSVFRNLPILMKPTDTRVAKKGSDTHSPRPRHAVVPVRLRSSWLAVRK